MAGQGVGGQQRQGDRAVGVAGHRVGQLVGIDLAPGHRLAGRRAGEAAGVGAGVGDLEEVVVAALGQAEHFLDLRLGLEDEVLRAAAAEDQDARRAAAPLGLVDDRGRLVDVAERVDLEPAPCEAMRGQVHADRAVAGARRVDRHARLVRRGEQAVGRPCPGPAARPWR